MELIRERITRTDAEMEAVRRILTGEEEITPSDSGSVVSGPTSKSKSRNGYLTPPSASSSKKSLTLSASSALSRSVSPFRKFARRLKGSGKSPILPRPLFSNLNHSVLPCQRQQEPSVTDPRSSILLVVNPQCQRRLKDLATSTLIPHSGFHTFIQNARSGCKYHNQGKTVTPSKQPWNSSTRVDPNNRSAAFRRYTTSSGRRTTPTSSATPTKCLTEFHGIITPVVPITSSVSTVASTNPTHPQRPPSRARRQV